MLEWYAYKHVNGKLFLRGFFDQGDIDEASSSPFVEKCTHMFEADTHEEAVKIMEVLLA